MSIPDFYKGKDILVTGGTGFMGKVLIEKLLRSCPDVNKIFILIRNKKGKSCQDRLKDLIEIPLFDTLKSISPDFPIKLEAINGDVKQLGLGISELDFEKIKNVSVIFHSAASVRFDDTLRDAVLLNTRGTLETMKLAEKLKNIEIVLHVSTTYCYPERHLVEEKLYEPYVDWETTIRIAEKFDDYTLNILKAKYSKYQPNTYTFTKSLAEQIVYHYKDKVPVVIYRPSIVISSLSDPIPGWIDNFNGPVGMLLACGLGIYRTMYGDPDVVSDYIPVDIAIKGMIAAAFEEATQYTREKEIKIYNCSSSSIKSLTLGEMIDTGKELVWEYPLEMALWIPGGSITKCRIYNYIRFMTLHVLVAVVVDTILKITKHKPFLVRLQRRIYAANLALHYFATTHWTFENTNFLALGDKLETEKCIEFEFMKDKDMCIRNFLLNAIQGSRKFLLKEPKDGMERAKRKQRKFIAINYTMKSVFFIIFIYLIISNFLKLYK